MHQSRDDIKVKVNITKPWDRLILSTLISPTNDQFVSLYLPIYSTFNYRKYSENTQKILRNQLANHDYRLVCADTRKTYCSVETKVDVNL